MKTQASERAPLGFPGEISGGLPVEDTWRNIVDDVKKEYLSEAQKFPWIIGFSGGKDSTVVTQAVFEALLDIPPRKRTRPVHIVSNDTLVESPLVIAHLNKVTSQIKNAAINLELPVTVARTQPPTDQSFWVLLIGRGYPSPNHTMRWCTDRLKILPTNHYIKSKVSESGSAIIVLGVRKDESASRSRSIEKFKNIEGKCLTKHDKLHGAYIYRPIVSLATCDIWEILLCLPAPWGGNHADLIQLYKDADGGECPVVLSEDEAPGCGTSNSRFGCWTCTVVEKDKSLQGFIDTGKLQYKPLVEFRDWLRTIRNSAEMRQVIRRNGKITFGSSGKHIPGPFTIQARKTIFERLLKVQDEFGAQLISEDEIDLIYKNWASELQQQKGAAHE